MMRMPVATFSIAIFVIGVVSGFAQAVQPVDTIEWVGGSMGEWNNTSAWRNVRTGVVGNAQTLMGDRYGSEGMNNIDPTVTKARNIVIGGGATVEYNALIANNDMTPRGIRLRQGSTLTIKDGATWVQDQSDYGSVGSQECRCDPSSLIIDGGIFRRIGESTAGEGGGNMIFNSYNDDNNQARLGTKPPTVNIQITNGGRLENTGQLWFGTDGESSPNTRGTMTINNGHLDLTGGDTAPIMNGELPFVEADLAFFFDNSENTHPDGPRGPLNEEFQINFTGTGSITVDSAGIFVYRQGTDGIWTGGVAPVSYQDLWNQGILTAHGLSGVTGVTVPSGINDNNRMRVAADFNEFFTVTGMPGQDNYTLTSITPTLQEVRYVGTNGGQWSDEGAWRNVTTNTTGNAATILGRNNGSNGMNTTSMTTTHARNITIPAGTTVNYHGNMIGDLRMNQGSTLTIEEGGVWQQVTDATFSENSWTQFDGRLVLNGGTFRRSGVSPAGDGGGLLMFGSYRDDEAFEEIGGPAKISVDITNGGRLENNGQIWFGADDEHSPNTRATVTINDGSIDLTGGTIPASNSSLVVEGDLAFFYDYSESLMRPKNEEWEINFTGPGSITVDSAGIWVYKQDENGIWNIATAGPLSYEDLWNEGILKANGLSGKMGITFGDNNTNPITLQPANFSTFFSVTGMPGMDNYTLTSLIEAAVVPGLDGDYNDDGKVDAADYVAWRKNPGAHGGDPAGYNTWRANFGRTAGSGAGLGASAGVPEPGTVLLLLTGAMLVSAQRRRRP